MSDTQSVSAVALGDHIIDVCCQFVNGSDAQGCKLVFVGGRTLTNNLTTKLYLGAEHHTIAFGKVYLTYPISCYQHVLAFDIETDNTTSSLAVEGDIVHTSKSETECPLSVESECRNHYI